MPVTNEGIQQDFCDHCLTVVKHAGTPKGQMIQVPDKNEQKTYKAYEAIPEEGKYNAEEAVVMCTDIFGLSLVNNLLLADAFADNGFQCYIPDYLNGDPVPQDVKTNPERAKTFSMPDWRTRHGAAQTRPALDGLIAHLRDTKGVKRFFGIGYCFGARYVMDLILEQRQEGGKPLMSKAAFAHPSQLKVPGDFEELIKMHKMITSSVPPLLFLTCENDPQFPIESQQKADELLEQLNEGRVDGKILYKRVYYAGNDHGFAVRGDVSKEHVKLAKEDAFKQAVQWFRR